jgi:small subunit ribosomal protein S3
VKVWVYKGEHAGQQEVAAAVVAEPEKKVRKSGAKHATAS